MTQTTANPPAYKFLPGARTEKITHWEVLAWAQRSSAHIASQTKKPDYWFLPIEDDQHYPATPDSDTYAYACHVTHVPDGITIYWHAIPYAPGHYVTARTTELLQLSHSPAYYHLPTVTAPEGLTLPPQISAYALDVWHKMQAKYAGFDGAELSAINAPDGEVSTPPAEGEKKTNAETVDLSALEGADRVEYLQAMLIMEKLALKTSAGGDPAKPDGDKGEGVLNADGNVGIAEQSEELERSERVNQDVRDVRDIARRRGLVYGGEDPDEIAGVVDSLDLPDMPGM